MTGVKNVGVVGAGLSGLACAVELQKKGINVEIFEADSKVGGRVQTDEVDGFLLDRGFQVYLPSYEMGQHYFDHKALNLKGFSAGAQIFYNDKFHTLSDPIRDPASFLSTLSNKLGTFKDKILILKLKLRAASSEETRLRPKTTYDFLKDFGFSEGFVQNFFIPFFSGVFLDPKLQIPHSYFLYLFNKFASSEASLPDGGMEQLPKQLALQVNDKVLLNSRVERVSPESVTLESGLVKNFDAVVLATPPSVTNNLLSEEIFKTGFNGTQTHYFKTQSNRFAHKKLFLNASSIRFVNHVACLSAVNKTYAPKGWSLFSVSTVGAAELTEDAVKSDLVKLFGEEELNTWQHLKTYKIKKALPSESLYGMSVLKNKGVYICGDYTKSPSIQGALSSGYQVSQEISSI